MSYFDNYKKWLDCKLLSEAEKLELISLSENEKEIKERFSKSLEFGTGGLRGIMRVGMNAMNVYTVSLATQALASYIISVGRKNESVVIAYDCRNNSELFAKTSAAVLAANGIHSYIFDGMRPTPELSFALRELSCVAGINVTASHNPKEYNGYKVYWDDGAQLSPESAKAVSHFIDTLDIFADVKTTDFDSAVKNGLISFIGDEIDEKYLNTIIKEAVNPDVVASVSDSLKIVYTPIHGTGYRLVPEILRRIGLKNLYTVEEQCVSDGNFPTVIKPNPEYFETFTLGIKLADQVGSDLVFATDPDADRLGAVARGKDGKFKAITGNQMGALLLDYILTAYESTDSMPSEPYAVKTIVTTELATKVCASHGVKMFNVLTGFKFIGEVIKRHENEGHGTFVFGFEESYGYLKGTYARDKDAVVTSMLVCEMAAYYKTLGITLIDALEKLYEKLGYSREFTDELYIEGLDGAARISQIMENFRNDPPEKLGGVSVKLVGDYLNGYFTNLSSGEKTPTELPISNVMHFVLENGDTIIARPSGTEPKIKFYYLINSTDKEGFTALSEAYKTSVNKYK